MDWLLHGGDHAGHLVGCIWWHWRSTGQKTIAWAGERGQHLPRARQWRRSKRFPRPLGDQRAAASAHSLFFLSLSLQFRRLQFACTELFLLSSYRLFASSLIHARPPICSIDLTPLILLS